MAMQILFWILVLLGVVYVFGWRTAPWYGLGSYGFLFALIIILGWHVFGAPIK